MAEKKKNFKAAEDAFITKHAEAPTETPEEEQPSINDIKVPKGFKLVKETKSARLQLLLRPTVLEGLKAQAAILGISTNELCDMIFSNFLNMES